MIQHSLVCRGAKRALVGASVGEASWEDLRGKATFMLRHSTEQLAFFKLRLFDETSWLSSDIFRSDAMRDRSLLSPLNHGKEAETYIVAFSPSVTRTLQLNHFLRTSETRFLSSPRRLVPRHLGRPTFAARRVKAGGRAVGVELKSPARCHDPSSLCSDSCSLRRRESALGSKGKHKEKRQRGCQGNTAATHTCIGAGV